MSRATEEKRSSMICFVHDGKVPLSRFSLSMHMHIHIHFIVTTNEFSTTVGIHYNGVCL